MARVRQISQKSTKCNTEDFSVAATIAGACAGGGQWITTYKWNGFFSLNSCLDKVAHFNGVIREAIDRFFPLTRTRAHQGDRPWVTPKIRAWIRNRQIFLARYGKDSQ